MKVGDKVRIIKRNPDNTTGAQDWNKPDGDVGKVGYIQEATSSSYTVYEKDKYYGIFGADELELIEPKEEEKRVRKIYRLKKDSLEIKKGTLFVDTGDEWADYKIGEGVLGTTTLDESQVVDNPTWFEEVEIKVEPKPQKERITCSECFSEAKYRGLQLCQRHYNIKHYQRKRSGGVKHQKHAPHKGYRERLKRAYAMHLNGRTVDYIARELDVHKTTANKYIREAKEQANGLR